MELLDQRRQLNDDRKQFYKEQAEFEERKRQLAELECQLNKQVWLTALCLTLWHPLLPYGYSYKAFRARLG